MGAPDIAIVVAMDRRGVIGRDGGLPWHLPADLQHFRRVTLGKPIVMGRRTHESIGRPLPGRQNIVISRRPGYEASGCQVVPSLADAVKLCGDAAELMVVGGAALYREALPLANQLHLTEVHTEVEGDVYFPALDRDQWRECERRDFKADERNEHPYSFVLLRR